MLLSEGSGWKMKLKMKWLLKKINLKIYFSLFEFYCRCGASVESVALTSAVFVSQGSAGVDSTSRYRYVYGTHVSVNIAT